MFCDYETGYAGKCGIWNCKKHTGKVKEVKKNAKSPKFRGNSKFQAENGYFTAKTGSNA